jgi:hypothetical protein
MNEEDYRKYSDKDWVSKNTFNALSSIANLLTLEEDKGRECLIRLLEHRKAILQYSQIVDDLTFPPKTVPVANGVPA